MSRLRFVRLFQQREFHKCLDTFQYKDNKYYRTLSKRNHILSHQVVEQVPFNFTFRLNVCNRTLSSQSYGNSYHSYVRGICNRHSDPQNVPKDLSPCPMIGGFSSVRGYASLPSGVSLERLQKYLDRLYDEYVELQNRSHIGKSEARRKKSLQSLMELREDLLQKLKDYNTLTTLISGLGPDDEEIRYMAEQEKRDYRIQIEELKQQILSCIIPKESTDKNDIILEVSQGIGGQEAMLFGAELFDMYRGLARYKGWEFVEDIYDDDTITGGIRNASASIKGENVYKFLKFESGVHRVQRVPATEKSGRVHTSTVTVAVLPKPTEIDMVIDPKEIKVETTTATGKGGQHVNKTESAVRMTHLPTGIIVYCQQDRSQIKNKVIAMDQLRTKVYANQLKTQVLEYKSQRKLQVGSAARSEKIRTYNFNQDRITDHRVQENLFNIDKFFKGGEDLEFLNGKLQEGAREDIVEEILEEFEKEDLKKVSKVK